MSKYGKDPNSKELLDNLGKIAYTLDKTYLDRLNNDFSVLPFDEYYNNDDPITYASNIRALKVNRWVYDKDEKPADCLKNVLSVFAGSESSIALIVQRTPNEAKTFFVTKNVGQGRNEDSKNAIELLSDSICGNFLGTETSAIAAGENTENVFAKMFEKEKGKPVYSSIAALCNVPSEKSEDYICQGIDKLLNGIVPKTTEDSYFIIILAESLPVSILRQILTGYQEMATAITPFAGHQFQSGENTSETKGEMESLSHSEGVSHSINKTHSVNVGLNGGVNSSETNVKGGGAQLGVNFLGLCNAGVNAFASIAKGAGASGGGLMGYGYSWGATDTKSETDTKTKGINHSVSLGTSENTTYAYKSYLVSDIIEKLEATIKRINDSQSTGLWKYASYVLSQNAKISKNIANFLRSISQGDESYIERPFIQEWSYRGGNGVNTFSEVQKYLKHFSHPVFIHGKDNIAVTSTTNLSTTELSDIFAFPRYSLQGLPVVECTRFGREPHSLVKLEQNLPLGCAYHMHQEEKQNRIYISKRELTKHTFITGSTGSGKSNTIYKILSELRQEETKFLVIEPTKGEYKNIFGCMDDVEDKTKFKVEVYGTNPKVTPLLRINPFKFHKDIHVLEHLDRLVELFNVCWPMYAAMPAILKDAVERAYIFTGWDLQTSENKYDDRLFPSFSDVLEQIRIVLNESDYSADNKGDYVGALATRLKSLTNGINGMIFTPNDLSDKELFDENVIVDLSRVGSTETKALIMGLLVMKLQEYRMTSGKQNADLNHITVLEEAHNLLKRTSVEQSADSANLLGKAVEMLSNAIAEMRTYGEGFIIADQSPGLLDMSVIRNTNTKIILRLPDLSDRELVGKAVGLNDSQIMELSRLERGIAAISQSDWLEPVLCKVDEFIYDKKKLYCCPDKIKLNNTLQQSLLEIIMNNEIYRRGDRADLEELNDMIIVSDLNTRVKLMFTDYLKHNDRNAIEKLRGLVYEFFNAKNAVDTSKSNDEIENWAVSVAERLVPTVEGYSKNQIDLVLALVVHEQAQRDASYNDILLRFSEVYRTKGGVYNGRD